jgi:hypothetical protein
MNKITPERQLNILDHLDEMSKKLNTFHQCTVYDDFLEDLKYVNELIRRDIGLPIQYEGYGSMLARKCYKCGMILDSAFKLPGGINPMQTTINYCKFCGQALYEREEISNG